MSTLCPLCFSFGNNLSSNTNLPEACIMACTMGSGSFCCLVLMSLNIFSSAPEISILKLSSVSYYGVGGRVVRWSWVSFQCRGVLLVWIRVGQGPTALAVGAGGGCLDIFTLIYRFSPLSPSLWETTQYRLKYCLKGSLSPKTTNQPTYYGFRNCLTFINI